MGIADHIPNDEKVGVEIQLIDDLQFFNHAGFRHCIVAIAILKPFHGEFFQQNPVVFLTRAVMLFVFVGLEFGVDFTAIDQLKRVADHAGEIPKGSHQRCFRNEHFVRSSKVFFPQLTDKRIFANGAQQSVDIEVGFVLKSDGVSDDPLLGKGFDLLLFDAVQLAGQDADKLMLF